MILIKKNFQDISLDDVFFDSLKSSYSEFGIWFKKKSENQEWAYISEDDSGVNGFLYIKRENESLIDIDPPLPAAERLKIGTFKIEARGTKMGERFIKKIFDHAIHGNSTEIYVTIFPEHVPLISLLKKYGFFLHGKKTSKNGIEHVYLKELKHHDGASLSENYPIIKNDTGESHLLSILPNWHSRLLPDSILKTENSDDIIEDTSHSNSIHKVYLCNMKEVSSAQPGDRILIYRPGESDPKWFKSVATSICILEEYRHINSFGSEAEFIEYCKPYSVFSLGELENFWQTKKYPYILRFMYNAALNRRITMQSLVEDHGLSRTGYWGYRKITNGQLSGIAAAGGINESLIIN